MKYFDAVLNCLYVLIMLCSSITLLSKAKTNKTYLMGFSLLIFALFDSAFLFKLVFENVSDYLLDSWSSYFETISYLGSSLALILIYEVIYSSKKDVSKHVNSLIFMWVFFILECALCFFPLENYFGKDYGGSTVIISLLKDIPLFLEVVVLFCIYLKHIKDAKFSLISISLLIFIVCQVMYHLTPIYSSFAFFIYGRNYSLVLIAISYLISKNYDYKVASYDDIHLLYVDEDL